MVEESIKQMLQKMDGHYKFNDLLTFMEDSGITFINRTLAGSAAIATLDGIFVDIEKIGSYPDSVIFFIFIHEIAHMKRINKYGKKWFLGLLSINDYDIFISELFKEEILADRYACHVFYKLNKIIYPWSMTQQLNLSHKQEAFKPLINGFFGKINNDENTYRQLIRSFIK